MAHHRLLLFSLLVLTVFPFGLVLAQTASDIPPNQGPPKAVTVPDMDVRDPPKLYNDPPPTVDVREPPNPNGSGSHIPRRASYPCRPESGCRR